MSFKTAQPGELVQFAYECSEFLLRVLHREQPQTVRKDQLSEVYNGQVISHDFSNDFQDPRNLDLIDRLIIPVFKDLLEEGRRREMGTAVEMAFGKEVLYAIEVLGSVKGMTFEEISKVVSPKDEKPVLSVVVSNPGRHLA